MFVEKWLRIKTQTNHTSHTNTSNKQKNKINYVQNKTFIFDTNRARTTQTHFKKTTHMLQTSQNKSQIFRSQPQTNAFHAHTNTSQENKPHMVQTNKSNMYEKQNVEFWNQRKNKQQNNINHKSNMCKTKRCGNLMLAYGGASLSYVSFAIG